MVKHPKYQAMDSAREEILPELIKEALRDKTALDLMIQKPKYGPKRVGPKPRPTFLIVDKATKEIWATFHPYGHYKCIMEEFEEDYQQIIHEAEEAAERALKNYNEANKNYPRSM